MDTETVLPCDRDTAPGMAIEDMGREDVDQQIHAVERQQDDLHARMKLLLDEQRGLDTELLALRQRRADLV